MNALGFNFLDTSVVTSHAFLSSPFFSKLIFSKNSSRITIRVASKLDPDIKGLIFTFSDSLT